MSGSGVPRSQLTAGDALRLDVERIDGLAGGHEQAVALPAAEAEVGAALGQQDAADQSAVGREHRDAVLAFAAGEAAHTLPSVSTRMPSAKPGEASKNTRPFTALPSTMS